MTSSSARACCPTWACRTCAARWPTWAGYLEAVTLEDYERGTIDEDLTDARQHRHRAALYRQGLARHFTDMGGGLWLSHRAQVPLFALEARDGA